VRELPSGTVTFLFTDVEGSTRLLREHGDGYAELLSEHRPVPRDAFERHDGVDVDTQGDAFFVAFTRAVGAGSRSRSARDDDELTGEQLVPRTPPVCEGSGFAARRWTARAQ